MLRLNTGTYAKYSYGSGTNNLTFWYTVEKGDETPLITNLPYTTTSLEAFTQGYQHAYDPSTDHLSALDVYHLGKKPGWIRRDSTHPTTDADLTLPSAGDYMSLSGRVDLAHPMRICTTDCPHIVQITSTLPPGTRSVVESAGH